MIDTIHAHFFIFSKWLVCLINVGSGFHCLRNLFFRPYGSIIPTTSCAYLAPYVVVFTPRPEHHQMTLFLVVAGESYKMGGCKKGFWKFGLGGDQGGHKHRSWPQNSFSHIPAHTPT